MSKLRKYTLKRGAESIGPLYEWEVVLKYDAGEISDTDELVYGGDVEEPQKLGASSLKGRFPEIRERLDVPAAYYYSNLLKATREGNEELRKIKWAVRGVGFLIALIILFGLTLNQK